MRKYYKINYSSGNKYIIQTNEDGSADIIKSLIVAPDARLSSNHISKFIPSISCDYQIELSEEDAFIEML